MKARTFSPNLQNIPLRTEIGKQIQSAFTHANKTIQEMDFSDLELRMSTYLGLKPDQQ
jgi:DNA polymerase I-like protein with 3'-5' exonuclease and polymerase domains